ncbi:phosphoribosylaminoimidazolesuccinocarboxamide synthase [Tundrisphaera lichenicola]|uniref:phosphoribosylaminoimidazolesuccinocarboxamide synthase n=1 Tax=Tundrisphaera lichenicola TaxID=2029860 RepID=UPI003EBB4794
MNSANGEDRVSAFLESALDRPVKRGKVRDVYDLGDRLLLVATDRISAYDWILPTGIPDKGRVLNGLSDFWFSRLEISHHRLSTNIDDAGLDLTPEVREALVGRSMIVRKYEVVPFECVVRGYLSGSAWREYKASGTVCGSPMPPGLVESSKIKPIFTPATKAESGHDENVSIEVMAKAVGEELAYELACLSLCVYSEAESYAASKGLILADTKFEFGRDPESGKVVLIDEALTPDSSRYWPKATYKPGGPQPSFDKQYVRDWLDASGWDKASPPPPLPDDVVAQTRSKYIQAYETLTGRPFPWK